METDYSDIIEMEHHVSKKHGRMSMYDRAAQFAPFAALVEDNLKKDETFFNDN